MKALVYEGPHEMKVREVEAPAAGPGEVLIRVAYSGICGSELSGYLGQNALRRPPLVFGHEFSGTVAEIGGGESEERRLSEGQPVTVNPLITCGRCNYCMGGRQQLCPERKLLSAHLPGSNAEYVKAPVRSVYPLPGNVSLERGALTEPVACAVRVAEIAGAGPSDVALVVGAGPIGLLAVQALKLHGAREVFVSDHDPERLGLAEDLGAVAVNPEETDPVEIAREATGGRGADVTVDAVGAGVTRGQCVRAATPGGKVIFSGLHEADSTLPVNDAIRNEVSLFGAFAYSALNFETALRWISEDRAGLSSGVVEAPLEEGARWFERLTGGGGTGTAKVLLRPSRQEEQGWVA